MSDKAQEFLDEMFPKLLNFDLLKRTIPDGKLWDLMYPGQLKGDIFSTVTNKFHPLEVRMMGGQPEVALTVECQDLDCSSSRFVGVPSVHFGFGSETIHLVVRPSIWTSKMKPHGPKDEVRFQRVQEAMQRYELVEKPKREALRKKWEARSNKRPRQYKKPYEQLDLLPLKFSGGHC